HLRELDIYINGQIVAQEGNESEGDEVVVGLDDNEFSSGGEEFDDSDSEYEYKMKEDQYKEEDVAVENDDCPIQEDKEELVDNVIRNEARMEDIDAGMVMEDEDLGNLSGESNLIWSGDELNSNKGGNHCKCEKCGCQGHNARGCATKTASNECIPDASSQVPPTGQPEKMQVRRKGKAIMQEAEPILHRRTRSGHIPITAPVTTKLHNRKAPKPSATAPSVFEQFQQCQK
ncbi:UNVERIFIED_CONTAM: hypothetical protein Sindi_0941600, partial [Sesamum indicum]